MKPSALRAMIQARHEAGVRRAIMLKGPPGCGKTTLPVELAKDMGIGCSVIHAPLMQSEDYGMPHINRSGPTPELDFIMSGKKFPFVDSDCPEQGYLVLDEVAQTGTEQQKILANLIQAREIHGRRLKDGWTIIATGNRATDRAGANRILSHFNDRMTEYEFEPDLNDWTIWALDHDVKPEVVQFIRFRPNLLIDFDPQREKNATPRGWVEGVSANLGVVPDEAEFETFKGDVGEGAAAEFRGFLKIYRKLPNPDAVLMDPKNAEVPTDPATLYALAGAIASRAKRDNFERVITYAERMPAEITVLVVRDSLQRDASITASAAYTRWCAKQTVLG